MSEVASNLTRFRYEPDEAHPGWHSWAQHDDQGFARVLGPMRVRTEDAADGKPRLRLRMDPVRGHSNMLGTVHGGVTLTLVDLSLFAAIRLVLGGDGDGAVTLDLSTQFFGSGRAGQPLDSVVEVLRETGRLVFLRGLVEQEGASIVAFSATVRKPTQR